MSTEYKLIILSFDDPLPHVAKIVINRPTAMNALNSELIGELDLAINEIEFRKKEIRAVVLTGVGRAFSAGGDVAEMVGLSPVDARHFLYSSQQTLNRLEALPMPTIAAINGFALGGGLETALACDIRIASSNAKIGFPEVSYGTMPVSGGTQRMTRLIGVGRAKRMILTGEIITAEMALNYGIITDMVDPDQLDNEVIKLLEKILLNAPIGVRLAKKSIENALTENLRAGLELALDSGVECFRSKDSSEGMRAFLEKRQPKFTGK